MVSKGRRMRRNGQITEGERRRQRMRKRDERRE
jgi:hypothetical protein